MEKLVGEIWKDIEGYEGLYQVSNLGRVKSVGRFRVGPTGNNSFFKERILAHAVVYGYCKVSLCKDGSKITQSVHRLVLTAFIQNTKNLTQVNHKDGNRKNNVLENLEWASAKENQRHKYDVLNYKAKKGFESIIGIPVVQISLEGAEVGVYGSCKDAQRQTGINNASINKCIRNKQHTAGGFKWERYGSTNF